jgi:hypothetical protein
MSHVTPIPKALLYETIFVRETSNTEQGKVLLRIEGSEDMTLLLGLLSKRGVTLNANEWQTIEGCRKQYAQLTSVRNDILDDISAGKDAIMRSLQYDSWAKLFRAFQDVYEHDAVMRVEHIRI